MVSGVDLLILNLEEVRRRSLKVWQAIPKEKYNWKPDEEALSCSEMIRHILASEYNYYQIILHGKSLANPEQPYKNRHFTTVEDEVVFSAPYREKFINYVQSVSSEQLAEIKIDRSDLTVKGFTGYIRSLGDFLLRIAYHESVHTGQLLDYLRTMGVGRPDIWD